MKKITIFSLSVLAVLFTACGEETKKVVEEVNKTKVAEAVKKDTISALETAKTKIAEAADAAKVAASEMAAEAKVEAEKMAAEAANKAEELKAEAEAKAEQLKQSATEAMAPKAPVVYDKCKACHGLEGKTAALGKSAIIAGQDKQAIITSMNAYKAGTKNETGMGGIMKGQAASLSDEDIEAIAEYLSKQ
jgi:cytochrome c